MLASFGDRAAAYLIDSVIVGTASLLFTFPLMIYVFSQAMPLSGPNGTIDETAMPGYLASVVISMGVSFVLGLLLSYLYHVELVLSGGQTPGKRIMKLHIVRVGTLPAHGLGRGDAGKRWGATVGLSMVPSGAYLDGLWQLWDKPY